jgi:tRNA U55 pseudouridine synthase TruB
MAKFTWDQIEILRQSPYVRKVGVIEVSFTGEFKRRFWEMYTKGNLMPREILGLLGINAEILGPTRIRSIAYNLKQELANFGEFSDIRRKKTNKQSEELPPAKEINKLRMEVEYLRQEQEFIKKIISAERGIKSK